MKISKLKNTKTKNNTKPQNKQNPKTKKHKNQKQSQPTNPKTTTTFHVSHRSIYSITRSLKAHFVYTLNDAVV